jgi:hypothetical protein
MFGELRKVGYIWNDLAHNFHSKIKHLKSLPMVLLLDAIRQYIMIKIGLRQRLCVQVKFVGHKIVTKVVSLLNERTMEIRDMNMRMIRCSNTLDEVYTTDKLGIKIRYHVDIANKTCSYMKWQVTGLPCCHALYFILKLRGEGAEIEIFADQFYRVEKFYATYAENVPQMADKSDWEIVNQGFKLEPPILRRPHGSPKKQMIEASYEKVPRF